MPAVIGTLIHIEVRNMLERLLTDRQVTLKYLKAGLDMAETEAMQHRPNYRQNARQYAKWEREYSRRGFATLPFAIFSDYYYSKYGTINENGMMADNRLMIGYKRNPGDKPVLYAERRGYTKV